MTSPSTMLKEINLIDAKLRGNQRISDGERATMEKTIAEFKRQLRMDSAAPARPSAETFRDLASYSVPQARADTFYELKGGSAPRHHPFEGVFNYRKRLATDMARFSPKYREWQIEELSPEAFNVIEEDLINDAINEFHNPTLVPEGQLIEKTKLDASGRPYQEFFGDPKAWLNRFTGAPKRLAGIRTANLTGWQPPVQTYKE